VETDQVEKKNSSEARIAFAVITIRNEMHKLIESMGKSKEASYKLKQQVNKHLKVISSLAGHLVKSKK